MMTSRRGVPAACSAAALASVAVICASPAGPARRIAGLILIGTFACAVWLAHRGRCAAIVPAVGLTLACLILAGLALAAVHALRTVPVALVVGALTVAAVWAGASFHVPRHAGRTARLAPPHPLAVAGVLIFAVAAALAVRYSAAGAAADADRASSVALWAYPAGDHLEVGVRQPAGHGAASLRIVVTQAGVTVATWNDIHLSPGQVWEAPALTVAGNGPAQVVALDAGTVVASLSSR